MFEELNLYLTMPEKAQIYFERNEFGVSGGYYAIINDDEFNINIHAANVFEFFSKFGSEFGVKIDAREIRKKFYSLTTFDKMAINGYGECEAISKAKRRKYLEKFEEHADLDEFLETLQNHVTQFQEYTAPIRDL